MSEFIEIVEVGPRDGLQNEKQSISLSDKVEFINRLSGVGFRRIEAASFVSPKWVPQMAESAAVLAGITRVPGVRYCALTPNLRGYHDAKAEGVDEVAIFASGSEGFSRANINASIAESLIRFEEVAAIARHEDVPLRGYVSCVTDCPYDGQIEPQAVAQVADALFAMGCYEISLGDTIGHGAPERVAAMLNVVSDLVPEHRLAGHYHDTNGMALDNIAASIDCGLRVFDASTAGLGGCPYAPGAAGNVATEKVNKFLCNEGFETGLNADQLAEAVEFAKILVETEGTAHEL